jgi:DNA-directed RNA polymerase sigma subunit (sigma70/sigma32)
MDNDEFIELLKYKTVPAPDPYCSKEEALAWYASLDFFDTYKSRLTGKEKSVIDWFYGLHGKEKMSARDISKIYDVTATRIYQIRDRGLRRLQVSKKRIENEHPQT